MITNEQLQQRTKYIGGSDCAAILGLSRYKTQLQVWAEKTGRVKPEDISNKLNVKLGIKLEDTVAELFMEETGKKVQRSNITKFHPVYDFIGANLDRIVVGEDAGLECKTASAWMTKEWAGEEIPQEYVLQCLHYMAVTGRKSWYLAVLIGNEEFKWKLITWDDVVIKQLIDKEVAFWNGFIVPEVMPMQITKDDGETLYQLYPVADPNKDVVLTDEANVIIEQITSITADALALTEEAEKLNNQLKVMLGDAESGRTNNYRVTWKNQNTNRIDTERFKKEQEEMYKAYTKTTKNRVLRKSKLKEK